MGKLRDSLTEEEADRAGAVFMAHRRFIESVAMHHAPGRDHVPDIVQAVGIQVCRGLNGFRSESEVTTWLYRVTVNTARKYYRRERRHIVLEQVLDAHPVDEAVPADQDEQVYQGQRLQALHDAIRRLSPQDRGVIGDVLADDGVLPYSRKARHRARQRLRQLLTDDSRLEPNDADTE